jgi:site-specific recombinase XerD
MTVSAVLDAAGRRRSPATLPGFHSGRAPVRRRFAPRQLRHAHAVELAREGVPFDVIQRQLGHANLATTSIYLQGIDIEEIISTVHARRAPMMSATAGLEL